MKLKTITWESAFASVEDIFIHPGLKRATFIFCDDKPNENNQGIEYEDFAEVSKSAIGTPVKLKFMGKGVKGHTGSIPIGHIASMTETELADGTHQLLADAVLYAEEYPDEITYLQESFAEGKAPGVSWELTYKNTILKDGINWLKGILTRAATFVQNPAYGSRTALLALASNKEIDADDFIKELSALSTELNKEKPKDKGGNNVTEEERLKAALEEAEKKIAKLEPELETAKASVTTLTTENETLKTSVTDKDTTIAGYAQKELIAKRTQALVDAGVKIETDAEKLAKKQAFWAAMPEEGFAEYVEDLKAAASTVKKENPLHRAAAERDRALPRFSGKEDSPVAGDIRLRMRELGPRTPVTNE